ncbi:MAG: sigW 5 [Deltaproteobacteria bacterium]|nr:sigW 5 [Deltaproteobacteria bacterium]
MGHAISTDAELLEASKRGERAAFGALVARYQRMVSAVSYSRTRDQALSEDVAQETFLAAWRQLDQLREPGRLRSWLCGIARNLARKARKRTDREMPGALVDELVEPASGATGNPFEAACAAQAERVVGEALARVPETYRDVLVLYYREQQSVREVSEALGISEAAALQRLTRGRQYLADGVTSLVETSLRGHRVKRNLAACVVAALPMIVPSRVEAASPSSHGGHMFKLALAAASIAAIGTTAYVVHDSAAESPSTAIMTVSHAPARAHIELPPSAPPVRRVASAAPPPAAAPAQPAADRVAPPPDPAPVVDRATVARLGLDRGPARGPADAPVTIVMFSDLKCPYCEKAHGSLDALFDEYPNKLRLVMKQLPVHKTAELAAEASLAAEAQGKYWAFHDQMLAHSEDLSRDGLLGLAKDVGMDVAQLRDALEHHTYAPMVAADHDAAMELEFHGTPSFVINGRRMTGALPMAQMRAVIDAALKD